MIRLFLRLFGIRDFEVCPSCETLKQQLSFANEEKKQLTETLLNIIKPKTYEQAPVELQPVTQGSVIFSKRRAALEARDREEAKIKQQAVFLGKPDDKLKEIEQLETELGVEEKEA
jgi:hypothetical protein